MINSFFAKAALKSLVISKLVITYTNRVMNLKEAPNQFVRQVFIDQFHILPPRFVLIGFAYHPFSCKKISNG